MNIAEADGSPVSIGVSRAEDTVIAAREFHRAVWRPNLDAVLFFCSPQYDLQLLGSELSRMFPDTELVGCTTAGEITPLGYIEGSITGVGLCAPDFVTVSEVIGDLRKVVETDLPALHKQLDDAGAPWTPGRKIPDWPK